MIDMDFARNTARYLHDTFGVGTVPADDDERGYTWRVRRTLEAGLFAVYGRAFVDTRSPGVYRVPRLKPPPTLPDTLRELHDWMLEQRSLIYVHTAAVELRPIPQLDDPAWRDHLRHSEDFNEAGTCARTLLRAYPVLATLTHE